MVSALLKTILFTIFVPGTVTVAVPYYLLSSRRGAVIISLGFLHYLAVPVLLLGAAMYGWCAWDFASAGRGTPAPIDPPKQLVMRGLYQYVRNPIYIGVLLVLLGEALLFQARILLEYMLEVFVFFFLFVLIYEEPALRKKFGESYDRYCATVPPWIPRLKREKRERAKSHAFDKIWR
ncbi:MAG TPA: methyltransferase [Acidobacteriota bacterium]